MCARLCSEGEKDGGESARAEERASDREQVSVNACSHAPVRVSRRW